MMIRSSRASTASFAGLILCGSGLACGGDAARQQAPQQTSAVSSSGSSDGSSPASEPDLPGAMTPPSEAGPAGPVPSAGCGKAGRPEGGSVTVEGDHIYQFPPSYDGATPLPVVFAFHANNNPIDQLRTATRGSGLEANFIMVFPKSVGSGWALAADAARLDGWYNELLSNYCIDTRRVYATGHSSGAQFIVQLMCRGEERFTAIAPVASSMYCASWQHPVPTLLIHGANDMERANTNQDADGRKDLGPYIASNQCSTDSAPFAEAACTSGGTMVNPGCVSYQGCADTLIWCSHDDPNYSNTNHGWPCFASRAMADFFSALP